MEMELPVDYNPLVVELYVYYNLKMVEISTVETTTINLMVVVTIDYNFMEMDQDINNPRQMFQEVGFFSKKKKWSASTWINYINSSPILYM